MDDFEEVKEKTIVKSIRRFLDQAYPGVWYKIHGGPYQEAGIPDIVGVHKGRFCAFEVKRPKRMDKVTINQQYQLDRLKKAGAITGVVTSVEEVRSIMLLEVQN